MKEQEEGLEKEAEVERLKAQRDRLVEKQQQLQEQVHRHSLYGDFLEEVVKTTEVLQVRESRPHFARAHGDFTQGGFVLVQFTKIVNIFCTPNTNQSTGGMSE